MKKLAIVLLEGTDQEPKLSPLEYLPGDAIAGYLTFNTSTNLKYTCIKIRFHGTVSTKVAKTSEEIYVLNQQVVLLGNPNNTEESVIQEGKYNWPFEFIVPLQHIPSSGKYRHSVVKYSLTAIIASKSFLGSMQETKTSQVIQIKDLINCMHQPYSNPVSANGSSNTKPGTNKAENLATATVQLTRSGYLKGQTLNVSISLSSPRKIQRDPGCWIQLLRKENYSAGTEKCNEYCHVVANSTHAINIEADSHTGNILAELIIPDNAISTMTTTKMASIQYYIVILFDMRPRTGFMERKSRRTVNKKLRSKLLESPGGFEIEIPVVIGTVSDAQHRHRASPFTLDTVSSDLGSTNTNTINSVSHLTFAASNLLLSATGSIPSPVLVASNGSSPSSSSPSSGSSSLAPTHDTRAGYNTLPVTYGRQTSEPNYHSVTPSANSYANRSRTFSGQQPLPPVSNPYLKPLPSLPSMFTNPQPLAQIRSELSNSFQTVPPASAPPRPSASSSSSSYPSVPPFPYSARSNSHEGASLSGPNGYPREKVTSPVHRHLHIQPPLSFQLPSPTAPQAVDLGMGPSSPGAFYRRFSQRISSQGGSSSSNSSSREEYFQYQSPTDSGIGHNLLQPQQQTSSPPESSASVRQLWSSPNSSPYPSNFEHENHSAPPYTQAVRPPIEKYDGNKL
ncbi:hypothetical protein BGX27_000002 [Mortierella sp. AM989]|nr:hypothetical protein BGX27_000002 [Mortierella sp. AM989]